MKLFVKVSLFILISGCSPQLSIYSDADPDYDLWSYRTFDWSEKTNIEANKNPIYYNELNDKRIKRAVTGELSYRGYQLASDEPELTIHYHIVVQDQMEIVTEPYGYSFSPNWMLRRSQSIVPYKEGSLIIDVMDTKSANLIWRGWAVAAIDRTYTADQTERLINVAVAKIFKKFPSRAKGIAITKTPDEATVH